MNLVLEKELPPFTMDDMGSIRIGDSRVLLEIVIRAFQNGASPEIIVQNYSTLLLADVYRAIGYYLNHQSEVELYLEHRDRIAQEVEQRLTEIQPDLSAIRARLTAQKSGKH